MSDNKRRGGPREGGAPHKKPKGHWGGQYKGSGQSIAVGSVGIYATCDGGKDKKATDELIAMLEETFTRLGKDRVGRSDNTAAAAAAAADDAGGDGSSKGSSIADMLAAEVAELKDKRKDRFKRREGGVRGTLFVEFPQADGCPSPEEVVLDICRQVQATQSLPSRHLMRLLPVSHTCGISKDEITALAAKVAQQHFPTGESAASIEFAVEFEHRASDKLDRREVIDIVAKAVQPPHKVNLKTPQKTILVQLVRTVCCISVLDSYKELARFNVRKLAEDELEQQVEQKQQAEVKQQPAAAAAAAVQEAVKQDEKQDGDAADAAAADGAAAAEGNEEAGAGAAQGTAAS